MTLQTLELDKKMQEYSISEFRNYPEYVKICEAFCVGLYSIQNVINYLSDVQNVDRAEGIWLDYLGWLVGTTRSTYDILQYFCVNAEHLNVEKLFYFEGASVGTQGTLADIYFRKKIRAKVAYNTSKTTRNENIKIIEGMVNADKVKINNIKTFDNFTEVGSVNISDGINPTTRYTVVGSLTITDGITPTTKYVEVGSPTITSAGIASDFSSSNYLSVPNIQITVNTPFSIKGSIKTGSDITTNQCSLGINQENATSILIDFRINGGNINLIYATSSSETSSVVTSCTSNTQYEYELKYNGTNLEYYLNGALIRTITNFYSTNSGYIYLGRSREGAASGYYIPFKGSIDLEQFSISINGNKVYQAWEIEKAGIASGFGSSNYLSVPNTQITANTPFIIKGSIKTGSNVTDNQAFLGINQSGSTSILLENRVSNGNLIFIFATGETDNASFTIPCSVNTEYSYEISYDGTSLIYTINGIARSAITTFYSASFGYIYLGRSREGAASGYYIPFKGSIDLEQFSISINGNKVYQAWEILEPGFVTSVDNSNYITVPKTFLTADNWKIEYPISHTQTNQAGLFSILGTNSMQLAFTPSTKVVNYSLSSNGTSWDVASEAFTFTNLDMTKDSLFVVEFTGTQYLISIIQNNVTLNTITITSSSKLYSGSNVSNLVLGNSRNLTSSTNGFIDLNKIKIIADKVVYRLFTIEPMLLDVDIYGNNLYYPSTVSLRETIETVIGNGVGLRNLVIHSSDTI